MPLETMTARMDRLISPRYLEMQKKLHASPRGYGTNGDKWAGIVLQIALQYRATSILDYGCGQGSLARALVAQPISGYRISEYDPAVPGKDYPPDFADMVVVTDVLEHIEPKRLDDVLKHIRTLARKVVFVVVATVPSGFTLPDGRNAHLIIHPSGWWKHCFQVANFKLHKPPTVVRKNGREWAVVLTP